MLIRSAGDEAAVGLPLPGELGVDRLKCGAGNRFFAAVLLCADRGGESHCRCGHVGSTAGGSWGLPRETGV